MIIARNSKWMFVLRTHWNMAVIWIIRLQMTFEGHVVVNCSVEVRVRHRISARSATPTFPLWL